MDYAANGEAIKDWLRAVCDAYPELDLKADVEVHPAFLASMDGAEDDRLAGASPVVLLSDTLRDEAVRKLVELVVDDRTLGGRVRWAVFERTGDMGRLGTIVVWPR